MEERAIDEKQKERESEIEINREKEKKRENYERGGKVQRRRELEREKVISLFGNMQRETERERDGKIW